MSDIKGYKILSTEQKDFINLLKLKEEEILKKLAFLYVGKLQEPIDQRWLAIARTNIEQGFMAAIRSIAQPETVKF